MNIRIEIMDEGEHYVLHLSREVTPNLVSKVKTVDGVNDTGKTVDRRYNLVVRIAPAFDAK